jgi:ATP-dependent DNA helicase DinG
MNTILSYNPLHSVDVIDEQENSFSLSNCMDTVSNDYQTLAKAIPGFNQRSGQEQIIRSCVQAVFNCDILVSQAGTGIGKTFSYLVGCMPFVRDQGKHLIVSTHTVALQTQLIEKDLPFVIKQLAPELKFEVAKGSSRYFCPKRALDLLSKTEMGADNSDIIPENGELFEQDTTHQNVTEQSMCLVKQIYQDFEQEKFSGDLDTLTDSIPTSVTSMVNRDHQRCPGQNRCPKGDVCPFYEQREKVKQADIVVTNHALLSQTMALGATILGDLADSIVVLDEAHHFADVMRDSNENKICQSNAELLVKQAKHLGQLSANILKNHP